MSFEATNPTDRTVRSAHTAERIAQRIGSPSADLLAFINSKLAGLTSASDNAEAKDTLIWLEESKIDKIVEQAQAKFEAGEDLAFDDLVQTTALAVAAFGRMFAAKPELQMEAALAVAHAITTHSTATEIDYFTAVDDDPTEKQGAGAGFLGLKMLTSGVFYSYMVMDRPQLRRNWLHIDSSDAPDRLSSLWRNLLCSTPTGMNAKAPIASLPALVVAVESTQPGSLASAFERPVVDQNGSGWLEPSIDTLAKWLDATIEFGTSSTFGRVWWASTVPDIQPASAALSADYKVANLEVMLSELTEWTIAQ
jgi:CRISPR system Cascade subunit CasC